jgi:glycosyltransferase involved in cell wall biosynthesis
MPSVSIIIPAYNAAEFIGDAIRSVLAQNVSDYEVIVVDDGSTDGTREVLRAFDDRVQYVRQNNRGVAAARNAGIAMARGQWVCFLDADDMWMPEKLGRQLTLAVQHPSVGLIFADAEERDAARIQKRSILETMRFGPDALRDVPLREPFRKLLVENFIPTSTVMIRTACFATAGTFDEELSNAEDRDLWLRIAAHFPIACVPQILAKKRSHAANISARTELALRSRIRVWMRARSRYPALAPAALCDRLVAEAYQQLGYLRLQNGDRREARQCAWSALDYAARHVAATRTLTGHTWHLSVALAVLSCVRWQIVRPLWEARNALIGRRNARTALS